MTGYDLLVLGIILLIVGGAVAYIIISKKRGKACIGCPDSASCTGNCKNCGACNKHDDKN